MEKGWIKIYETNKVYLASLLKIMLDDNKIQCVLVNKQDSSYHFGEVELFVRNEVALKAIHLIQKFEEAE